MAGIPNWNPPLMGAVVEVVEDEAVGRTERTLAEEELDVVEEMFWGSSV